MTLPNDPRLVEQAIAAAKKRSTYKGWPLPSLDGPLANLQESATPEEPVDNDEPTS